MIGFRGTAQTFQRQATARVQLHVIPAECRDLGEVGQRCRWLIEVQQDQSTVQIGDGEGGVAFQGRAVIRERFVVLAKQAENVPAVEISPGKLRPERHAGVEISKGECRLAQLEPVEAALHPRPVVARVEAQGQIELRDGLAITSLERLGRRPPIMITRVCGRHGHRPGVGASAGLPVAQPIQVKGTLLPKCSRRSNNLDGVGTSKEVEGIPECVRACRLAFQEVRRKMEVHGEGRRGRRTTRRAG